MKPLRIAFMGTPDFAVAPLDALYTSGHELVCVYTQPPRPKGRSGRMEGSPVHQYAEGRGILVRTPKNYKDERDVQAFRDLNLDVAVVAAFGMLLPESILNAPRFGCLNIHPSLLPRWRGPSPVQYAIWKGDAETGVCVMQLVKQMDAGPVISRRRVPVRPQTTFESLNNELWALGSAMIEECVNRLAEDGGIESEPQPEDGVTFCKLLTREDGRIDWTQSASDIDRQIRGLTPWPGVWTTVEGRRLKILEAEVSESVGAQAEGMILNRHGLIACGGDTALKLLRVQPENAKPMDAASAFNGGYLREGIRLT